MFEDEADTISADVGFDTRPRPIAAVGGDVDAFDHTRPLELKTDTFRDASPFEQVHEDIEFEDTDILVVSKLTEEASVTSVSVGRPGTNADWPPAPKLPASRQRRRAGMYKAISSITKLTAIE